MTTIQDIEHFFEVAKTLTLEAAEIIRQGIQELKTVMTKTSDKDLVTEYDNEVERFLFTKLAKEFPDHKFIGEETSSSEEKIPELTDSPTWIIDPIDGTTNFVHTFPQICISVGLAIKKKLEIGIICNPCSNELYTAKRGQGAFLNGKPIRTSSIKELKNSLVNFENIGMNIAASTEIQIARFRAFVEASHGVRTLGSAALALAYVARGSIDVFQMDGLKSWDVAAGNLIVTEAGGTVIDTKGGAFNFMAPKVLAASNEALAIEASNLMIETDIKTERKKLG